MNFYSNQLDLLNQNLTDISKKIYISFEFFPIKDKKLKNIFFNNIIQLNKLKPKFFTVTQSSNAKNIDLTFNIVKKIKQLTKINVAPHMTCINKTNKQLLNIGKKYWDNNIKHIVALRGDYINENIKNKKNYGIDLVVLLKKIGNFDISVAAYPEIHPEAKNAQSDLINLKNKIDAGANRAITQFFFSAEKYLRFRDRCISIGINVDIIPGIMPVFNFKQLKHFSSITNVNIPEWMHRIFLGLDNDLQTSKIVGTNIAIDMIKILIREGVENFHFYTLNCAELSYAICHMMGIKNLPPVEINQLTLQSRSS